jgi:cyclic 2,3-diphosphoglycerate synthetase
MGSVPLRVIALVDGEHHPPVTRWGVDAAREAGYEVVAALLVGGVEKLDRDRGLDVGGVAVLRGEDDPHGALAAAICRGGIDAVLDLSDEPVLPEERRMQLAAVALRKGLPYIGPDFRFDPPITEAPLDVPTLAVVGTGKRVGKTSVSAHLARLAVAAGSQPAIVAMGRGGPGVSAPTGPADVTLDALIARAERGEHAASDHLEDAMTAGVPTVGARRVGGGLVGRPFATNVAEAAAIATDVVGAGLVILEGSGSAIPTVPWDAGVLVVPGSIEAGRLTGYGGPLRMLLSDLVVFILGGGPDAGPDDLSTLTSHVRRLAPDASVAVAELQPVALGDVKDKDAFFATTARGEAAVRLAEHLERTAGCRIVGISSRLADRAGLEEDLRTATRFDVLVTELKAAAVDVAARRGLERGAEVVFVDNRPVGVGGDGELEELLDGIVREGFERASARGVAVAPGAERGERTS